MTQGSLGGMLTQSGVMLALFERIRRLAPSPLPVMVAGETGSGKELVARALHEASGRTGAFVAVNCGALAATLVESELFGHTRGAFTGASADRPGVFEAADGGTLFLDELGELPLELQPRLLRVLEARAVRRVGATREVSVDVRVVGATHRDLGAMVASGAFREDLYHRLMIVGVRLPPLRERREDVPLLAARFLDEAACRLPLTAAAEQALLAHAWPGNVRELRNVMLRAALLCGGPAIDVADLELPRAEVAPVRALRDLTLEEERQVLVETLRACGGNRSRAARRLGISRSAFHERLRRLGVPPKQVRRPLLAAV